MKTMKIESKTMNHMFYAYMLMAVVAFVMHIISNSEAILFDGIFNAVSALSMIVGVKILKIVPKKPTKTLPLGYCVYETLFTLSKGLLLLGILLWAGYSSIIKIYATLTSGISETVNGGGALIYSVSMVSICTTVYIYLVKQYKKTDKKSIMLNTERIAVSQNTIISAIIGVVFLISNMIENTFLSPIIPFVDPVLVIFISILLFNDPKDILTTTFNELIAKDNHDDLREKVNSIVEPILTDNYTLNHISINRFGRTHYFKFFLKPLKESMNFKEVESTQDKIKELVNSEISFSFSDIILSTGN